MKTPQPHKTKEIAIKYGVWAEVDCEIVPLVKWLNARRSVVTDTSCQGNSDAGKGSRPTAMECSAYVKFGVGDMKDLDLIARKIAHAAVASEMACTTRSGTLIRGKS